jgi:hypothetical protein
MGFSRNIALLGLCLFTAAHLACGSSEESARGGPARTAPERAAASSKPPSFTGDPDLILGTWQGESEYPDKGVKFKSETTYTAPDKFVTRGSMTSTVTGGERQYEFSGTWAIKGGLLSIRLRESNLPLFPVGSGSSKRIEVLNEKELVILQGGREIRGVRKSP